MCVHTDLMHVGAEQSVLSLDAAHKAPRRHVATLALLTVDLQQAERLWLCSGFTIAQAAARRVQ